ncbi:hypothetical protein [Streptomyces sp. NRRL B-24085]|uniref:hypothetical protein n=1 Tax=Streptomyces sp. NRRL B-24085 TaxID=1709476 RepID=UPI00118158AD|nr:hypothetical protein [Streptomyces sp. NRRL B-24085]
MTSTDSPAFERAWTRFASWLQANSPVDHAMLRGPAVPERLIELESRLGFGAFGVVAGRSDAAQAELELRVAGDGLQQPRVAGDKAPSVGRLVPGLRPRFAPTALAGMCRKSDSSLNRLACACHVKMSC